MNNTHTMNYKITILAILFCVMLISPMLVPESYSEKIAPNAAKKKNSDPVAQNQAVSTQMNMPITITLLATDADNDKIKYAISKNPANGKITGNPPTVTYTPKKNYSGADSFTFTASDPKNGIGVGTITIKILSPNRPPVVKNLQFKVLSGSVTTINPNDLASDPDGDKITITSADTRSPCKVKLFNNAIELSAPTLAGIPESSCTINYSVKDSSNAQPVSGSSFVIIFSSIYGTNTSGTGTTQKQNHLPVLKNAQFVVLSGSITAITPNDIASDPDGDNLILSDVTAFSPCGARVINNAIELRAPTLAGIPESSCTINYSVKDSSNAQPVSGSSFIIIKNG